MCVSVVGGGGGGGGVGFELLLKIVVQCYYYMYYGLGELMIHAPSKGSDQPGPLSLIPVFPVYMERHVLASVSTKLL